MYFLYYYLQEVYDKIYLNNNNKSDQFKALIKFKGLNDNYT